MANLRILLVDDYEVVRKSLATLLLGCVGYEVCGEAGDGQEAVQKVLELKPDLVLLDISMPRMSGLEATRLIRKLSPKTKIVILSVHDSVSFATEAKLAGADGYLTKTCPLKQLQSQIAEICGGGTGQTEAKLS